MHAALTMLYDTTAVSWQSSSSSPTAAMMRLYGHQPGLRTAYQQLQYWRHAIAGMRNHWGLVVSRTAATTCSVSSDHGSTGLHLSLLLSQHSSRVNASCQMSEPDYCH